MRKITVLTILLVLIGLGLSSVFSESRAQKVNELTVQFKEDNADFMRWFNNGQVDSLLTIYRNDACVLPENVCGKDNIRELFNLMINEGNYKFLELTTQSISVCDTIAVEKGKWTVKLNSGPVIKGMFMSEWRYSNKKWQIVYDISSD